MVSNCLDSVTTVSVETDTHFGSVISDKAELLHSGRFAAVDTSEPSAQRQHLEDYSLGGKLKLILAVGDSAVYFATTNDEP